jgi:hypothetical protein
MFRAFLIGLFLFAIVGILLIYVAWYIPNPWIRHEFGINGKGYYLFCPPEEWNIPGNLPAELFPGLDWCSK